MENKRELSFLQKISSEISNSITFKEIFTITRAPVYLFDSSGCTTLFDDLLNVASYGVRSPN